MPAGRARVRGRVHLGGRGERHAHTLADLPQRPRRAAGEPGPAPTDRGRHGPVPLRPDVRLGRAAGAADGGRARRHAPVRRARARRSRGRAAGRAHARPERTAGGAAGRRGPLRPPARRSHRDGALVRRARGPGLSLDRGLAVAVPRPLGPRLVDRLPDRVVRRRGRDRAPAPARGYLGQAPGRGLPRTGRRHAQVPGPAGALPARHRADPGRRAPVRRRAGRGLLRPVPPRARLPRAGGHHARASSSPPCIRTPPAPWPDPREKSS